MHSSVARKVSRLSLAFLKLSSTILTLGSNINPKKFIFALIVAIRKTYRYKKKRDETTREFQDSWTTDYLFIDWKHKPLCLVFGTTLSISKLLNVKRLYQALHQNKYDKTVGKLREDLEKKLRNSLCVQQSVFKKPIEENENAITASFVAAEKVVRYSKPFIDGEFVRECIPDVAKLTIPQQAHLF